MRDNSPATMVVRTVVLAVALTLCLSLTAGAVELWSDDTGERSLSLNASLKWTSLLSHAPEDTVLYPEEWSATSLWRFRAVVDARPAPWLAGQVAYEHRARVTSEGVGVAGAAGIVQRDLPAPYRFAQADDALIEVGDSFSYRHELDRAFVSVSLPVADVTVGRQAVGWGRGLLFGAVDVFAPFSPLESDREWRRGIDAVRLRIPVTDLFSADAVAAFGESAEESAFIGRLHGYAGDIDGELLVGRRCEDDMFAASVSLPVLGAELHGEAALFLLPEPLPGGGSFGSDDLAVKALVGGSRTFDMASGLMLVAEYHYSGFGVADIRDATGFLMDPDYLERYLRGDSQILGKHACALQLSYGFAGVAPVALMWIASPVDGSGVIVPSGTWVFSDSVTLSASAYLPHGAGPDGAILRSEYGGTPAGGLLQISFYY